MKMKKIAGIMAALMAAATLSAGTYAADLDLEDISSTVSADKVKPLALADEGDVVEFGHYEIDGSDFDGEEAIQWTVIKREGEYKLLLSNLILDGCIMGNSGQKTYEDSEVRTWLNSGFLDAAFDSAEKNVIVENNVTSETGNGTFTKTKDKVFIFSDEEMNVYATRIPQTALSDALKLKKQVDFYWSRNGYGLSGHHAFSVDGTTERTFSVDDYEGVRPALWVKAADEDEDIFG